MKLANSEAWLEAIPSKQPDQIAYVVADLDSAIAAWSGILGRSDWRVYTYGPHNTKDLRYRGSSAGYSMRLALCGDSPQVELIESVSGPNVYTEWLDRDRAGLHHVGFFVESLVDSVSQLAALGIDPVQSGRGYGLDGDGGYAYYELPGVDGLVEYIEVPKRRAPSETLVSARQTES